MIMRFIRSWTLKAIGAFIIATYCQALNQEIGEICTNKNGIVGFCQAKMNCSEDSNLGAVCNSERTIICCAKNILKNKEPITSSDGLQEDQLIQSRFGFIPDFFHAPLIPQSPTSNINFFNHQNHQNSKMVGNVLHQSSNTMTFIEDRPYQHFEQDVVTKPNKKKDSLTRQTNEYGFYSSNSNNQNSNIQNIFDTDQTPKKSQNNNYYSSSTTLRPNYYQNNNNKQPNYETYPQNQNNNYYSSSTTLRPNYNQNNNNKRPNYETYPQSQNNNYYSSSTTLRPNRNQNTNNNRPNFETYPQNQNNNNLPNYETYPQNQNNNNRPNYEIYPQNQNNNYPSQRPNYNQHENTNRPNQEMHQSNQNNNFNKNPNNGNKKRQDNYNPENYENYFQLSNSPTYSNGVNNRPNQNNNYRPTSSSIYFPDDPDESTTQNSYTKFTTTKRNYYEYQNKPHENTKRISEIKCEEYSKALTTTISVLPLSIDAATKPVPVETCDSTGVGLIVGGSKAELGEFPHMAAIEFRTAIGNQWNCGGTLISERFVLTAAHCTISSQGNPVRVRLGELNIQNSFDGANPVDVVISEIIVHPDYVSTLRYNDIALLRLEKKVKFNNHIRPACLHNNDNIYSPKVTATGWGSIAFGDHSSDELLKVVLDVIDNRQCNKLYEDQKKILNRGIIGSMMCAGDLAGGHDTCLGDSGGPLVIKSEQNACVFNLIGITSFGKGCAAVNSAGVYTRVSSFLPWIEKIVWP